MAIAAELAHLKNEKAFRDDFLIPMLQRLGFSVVVNYHGTQELGKDIVFAEIDRFGHIAYHAIQAKFVPTIGLGKQTSDLIYDAEQAFSGTFRHPQTGTEQRISTFYAFNGGTISDQAKQQFFNSLQPKFGDNVRLMDGAALIALDRNAAFSRSGLVRERLSGLMLEASYNLNVLLHIDPIIAQYLVKMTHITQRFRHSATESLLSQPLMPDARFNEMLNEYWQRCHSANLVLDKLFNFGRPKEWIGKRIASLMEFTPSIRELSLRLIKHCHTQLSSLGMTMFGIENRTFHTAPPTP